MLIYKDSFNKIVYEAGQIVRYVKNIFGHGWQFAEVLKICSSEEAAEIRKQIKTK